MNTELFTEYKKVRGESTIRSTQAFYWAKRNLELKQRPVIEFADEDQFVEWGGFYVQVKVRADDEFMEHDYGDLFGVGEGLEPWRNPYGDEGDYVQGDFAFERSTGWHHSDTEIVGFTMGDGTSFADILEYYRSHLKLSKQMAYEAAMRNVRSQLDLALRWNYPSDKYNSDFASYGVNAAAYASEEAYDEPNAECLGESSCWGFIVDTSSYIRADKEINEFAWEQVEEAVREAQRAEYHRIEAAGNVPLFGRA